MQCWLVLDDQYSLLGSFNVNVGQDSYLTNLLRLKDFIAEVFSLMVCKTLIVTVMGGSGVKPRAATRPFSVTEKISPFLILPFHFDNACDQEYETRGNWCSLIPCYFSDT